MTPDILWQSSRNDVQELRFEPAHSPWGEMLAVFHGKRLCYLVFMPEEGLGKALADLKKAYPKAHLLPGSGRRATLEEWLQDYCHRPMGFALEVFATEFQQRVWRALMTVACGETLSYGELGRKLGQNNASQAIGGAVGANELALIIPCHRVIRSDGSIGGFGWGVERKRALLAHEGRVL